MAVLARRYACASLLHISQELREAWLDSGVAMLTSSVLICIVPKEHPFVAFVVQNANFTLQNGRLDPHPQAQYD